ncbi:MAG: PilZ domain-containing protein [Gammaproteobacteria bacterium]|jgi:c-di-GMP-binding flagellar brake protein YcgR|nr:PilZ domain-containing protein [Gammaproteobacteria bacterium]MBT3723470.1 PilZ domain-containing protein [Gammaproteobacteria bacterium]MBT4076616.1 PilZ domain-containing protein [Gammaproteobacteria bacterium]MBT4194322.1 PilZ domain-containing protein [Gammaproteobacteria bacterium]MBT4450876.1 PilZ domain-containing protein [Gammaproteobacteria bacterium]
MSDERRRFFRIEDIVGLKSQVIEKQELEQRLESFWNDQHQFSLRNEFNFKLEQHQADLQHIKNKMPELGRYLSVLQEQLDLLTDKILTDEDNFSTREIPVNISAQGISFISDEQVNVGDIVELNLLLLPSQQKIVTFAKVIECNHQDNNQDKYTISLDFEHIHEADRELLVKHVHRKQLKSLGAARFEENT